MTASRSSPVDQLFTNTSSTKGGTDDVDTDAVHNGGLDDLPQTKSLDHADPFLSPNKAPEFDVDAFLVSRASGATLPHVAEELRQFGISLKVELDEVVDRDFRGFVNLGVALKAEGPRIARLDWKVGSRQDNDKAVGDQHDMIAGAADASPRLQRSNNNTSRAEQEWVEKFDVPRNASGNLGLERVRIEMEHVRDRMRAAEHAVRLTLQRREAIEVECTNLRILLSFNESLARLESLLLPTELADNTSDELQAGDNAVQEDASRYWRAFEQAELDGGTSQDESDYLSLTSDDDDDADDSDTKHKQVTAKQNSVGASSASNPTEARRRLSGIAAARRRSSFGLSIDGTTPAFSSPSSKLTVTLPSRIARASSEHAALMFLSDQARGMGYGEFVDAHDERVVRVRDALKADLDKLIKAVTGLHSASLLIVPQAEKVDSPYGKAQLGELASWSQTGSSFEEQLAEQRVWLELALATWITLPQSITADRPPDMSEAEDAVSKALVEPWCSAHIQPSALSHTWISPASKTSKTLDDASTATLQPGVLLASDISSPGQPDPKASTLIELYNDILRFVLQRTIAISSIAENVIQVHQKRKRATTTTASIDVVDDLAHCDLYVHSVWRAIATRLMEQVGGQLFFVGRPEDFRRNYTVSMAFVRAFERLAPSERALEVLRRDAVYQTFRRRWQLPVYFQMRLRETVSDLEAALLESSDEHFGAVRRGGGTAGEASPVMAATRAVLQAFAAPWSSSSHIRELIPRQWRLSLQVISRFRIWVQDQLPADVLPAHRRLVDAAARTDGGSSAPLRSLPFSTSSATAASDQAQRIMSSTPSGTGSPSRAGTPTSHDADFENQLVHLCTAVAADLKWFEEQARVLFDSTIAPLIVNEASCQKESSEIVSSLRDSLNTALSLHAHVGPLLAGKVTSVLKARCAEPLRLVRSVSTQYRSASTATPQRDGSKIAASIEPSYFVAQFLRPVRHYLGKFDLSHGPTTTGSVPLSSLLPRSVREDWIKDVIEDFIVRYTASLQTMSKNFESLQRLKRVNAGKTGDYISGAVTTTGGLGGGGGDDGETDKMHAQMTVDVEYLQREVSELQVVLTSIPTDTPAWNRLRAAARGESGD